MSKTGEIIGSLAANFLVAGIVGKLEGGTAATISFTIGLALLAAYFLLFRKRDDPNSPHPIHVENKPDTHIENKPIFENKPVFENKPTIIISTGAAPALAPTREDIEKATRESVIIEHLKKTPNLGYDVQELSQVANASMPEVRDIMENLVARKVVWSVGNFDAVGGKAYFIDALHLPNPPRSEPRAANTVAVAYDPIEHEKRVMEFLKTADPIQKRRLRGASAFHEAELIARELKYTFRNTWDALERLEKQGRVCRTKVDQARGGALWRLDDRED